MTTTKPALTQSDVDDYYSNLEPLGLRPLWRIAANRESHITVQPHIWKWREIYSQLARAGEVMRLSETQGQGPSERRALLLVNPGLKQFNAASNNLTAAIQMIF